MVRVLIPCSSFVPRPHPACISLPVLKAIHAGVGFGSGTETTHAVAAVCVPSCSSLFPKILDMPGVKAIVF